MRDDLVHFEFLRVRFGFVPYFRFDSCFGLRFLRRGSPPRRVLFRTLGWFVLWFRTLRVFFVRSFFASFFSGSLGCSLMLPGFSWSFAVSVPPTPIWRRLSFSGTGKSTMTSLIVIGRVSSNNCLLEGPLGANTTRLRDTFSTVWSGRTMTTVFASLLTS